MDLDRDMLTPPELAAPVFLDPDERHAVRRKVRSECQVVASLGFRLLGEEVLDISTDGVLLKSEAAVALGEEVYVSLKLPKGQTWIGGLGRVARVVRRRRAEDVHPAIGIEFTKLEPFEKSLLDAFLEGRPEVPASRGRTRDLAPSIRRVATA